MSTADLPVSAMPIGRAMHTIVHDADQVCIPMWVQDHGSFRAWMYTDDYPETGRICYLGDSVWVDIGKEQLFSHNQVKNEVAFTLTGVAKQSGLGRYFPDGLLLTNLKACLTCQPDGTFVAHDSFHTGRVNLVEGASGGFLELEGAPDMVLEVISESSQQKDRVRLMELYWLAGIREYWLIDARFNEPEFEIHRHAGDGYTPARRQSGWLRSSVFKRAFRIERQTDELGHPEVVLSMK